MITHCVVLATRLTSRFSHDLWSTVAGEDHETHLLIDESLDELMRLAPTIDSLEFLHIVDQFVGDLPYSPQMGWNLAPGMYDAHAEKARAIWDIFLSRSDLKIVALSEPADRQTLVFYPNVKQNVDVRVEALTLRVRGGDEAEDERHTQWPLIETSPTVDENGVSLDAFVEEDRYSYDAYFEHERVVLDVSTARIASIDSRTDWVNMVEQHPRRMSFEDFGDFSYMRGFAPASARARQYVGLDWRSVSEMWDGVYLSLRGFMSAAYDFELETSVGTAPLAAWDPGTTKWVATRRPLPVIATFGPGPSPLTGASGSRG